jgi:hypothetical protein
MCLNGLKTITELSKRVAVQLVRYIVRNSRVDGDLFTDQIKLRNVLKKVQGISMKYLKFG